MLQEYSLLICYKHRVRVTNIESESEWSSLSPRGSHQKVTQKLLEVCFYLLYILIQEYKYVCRKSFANNPIVNLTIS